MTTTATFRQALSVGVVGGFALGCRMDKPSWIWKKEDGGRRTYLNLSHLIAHEVGHFFGFPHINDENSIMYCSLGADKPQRWQEPEPYNLFFKALAYKLKA